MSNLTIIIVLAVVIIVASIATAFGKAVGAGGNVKDLFPEHEKSDDQKSDKKKSKSGEGKTEKTA